MECSFALDAVCGGRRERPQSHYPGRNPALPMVFSLKPLSFFFMPVYPGAMDVRRLFIKGRDQRPRVYIIHLSRNLAY
jgi:hypothetical protein